MANKSIKLDEIKQLVREMVEAAMAQPETKPAPSTKPDVAPAPDKEKEQRPIRRGLPNPDKAPDPTPKGERKPSATEMSVANKMADKFNKLSGK